MIFNPPETANVAERTTGDWFVPWRFAALLGLLLVASFPRVVAGLRTFGYLDFGQFAYPVAFYHRECFWRGEMPFWNPLNDCGVPFLAQWNTMTLYPLSLVYLVLPFPWSLNLFCLLHLILGGLGMYFLAWCWTGHRLAAAAAGAVFAFNGLTWYALIWPHLTVALAWMPWVVLAMERAWSQGGRAVILAGLAGAMQMLSGGAEVILLTWLLLLVDGLVRLFQKGAPRVSLIGRTLGAGCLVAGLAAAQLFPFLELLSHSQRSGSYGNSSIAVMPLTGLANYLVPNFHCARNPQGLFVPPNHWTGSYYLGVGMVALALLAAWRARDRQVWLLLGLAVFGLLMAMGGPGLVYDWLARLAPVLGFMRFPIKFIMLTTFVVPLLATAGLAWLVGLSNEAWPGEWRRVKVLALTLLGLMAVFVLLAQLHPVVEGELGSVAKYAVVRAGFLTAVLGCIAGLRRSTGWKSQALLQSGLLGLLWLDVATHNANLSPTLPPAIFEPDAVRQYYQWNHQIAVGAGRIMESKASFQTMLAVGYRNLEQDTAGRRLSQFFNFNLLDHAPKFDGFYSLELKEFSVLFNRLYYGSNEAPRLLDFLGVARINNPTNLAQWLPRDSCLPLVTGGQQPVFEGEAATLDDVMSDRIEPQRIVYLPLEARGLVQASAPASVKIHLSDFSAHRLGMEVEAAAPAMVVVAQTFYPAWRAYVDEKATSVWRANYAFQALEVPSGKHHVTLVYEDRAFLWGAFLSLGTMLLCGLGWFSGRLKLKPKSGRPSVPAAPTKTHG
jgi:hypothetical protein